MRGVRRTARLVVPASVASALGAWCAVVLGVAGGSDARASRPTRGPAPPPVVVGARPEGVVGAAPAEAAAPPPEAATPDLDVADERLARDRGAAAGHRAAALRRLARASPARARDVALEATRAGADLPSREDDALTAAALATLADLAREAPPGLEVGREALQLLRRCTSPEVALACGAALDVAAANGLPAVELRQALRATPSPVGRVALLRALELTGDGREREVAAEEALRDEDPLVRATALAGLSERQLAALAHVIAADPDLRRAAPRALRRARGPEARRLLASCAAAEPDVEVARALQAAASLPARADAEGLR
ncbi:MAG: hypothetical protein M9894_10465 [Planctomycetes bacterium]|nr:hypothetical protein [Planctomycetota bacterium]